MDIRAHFLTQINCYSLENTGRKVIPSHEQSNQINPVLRSTVLSFYKEVSYKAKVWHYVFPISLA